MTGPCDVARCEGRAYESLADVTLCHAHYMRLLRSARLERHGRFMLNHPSPYDCYVYFARLGDYIKIGHSANVPGRLRALKYAALDRPADLPEGRPILLAAVPAMFADEARMHQRFVDSHAFGEWFHATPDLLAYVEAMHSVRVPTAVPA